MRPSKPRLSIAVLGEDSKDPKKVYHGVTSLVHALPCGVDICQAVVITQENCVYIYSAYVLERLCVQQQGVSGGARKEIVMASG